MFVYCQRTPDPIGLEFTCTHALYPGRIANGKVLREATREEWIASVVEMSGREPANKDEPNLYFYEASLD